MATEKENKSLLEAFQEDAPEKTELETLTEKNNDRLALVGQLGGVVNGINEALILRCLERLLGPVATAQVQLEQQQWLATQLDSIESQVLEQTGAESMEAIRTQLSVAKKLHLPGRN